MESQHTFSWISKAFIPKGIEGLRCYSKCGHFDLCIVVAVAWIYKGNREKFSAGKCFDNNIPEGWKFYSKEN